ncbi:MAG TPA: hypothetical protein VK604_27975 [Bryobacteraceae bacterium]|nr:hypothetical protein [Bryobacteraceae bacterium]HTF71979.1 hypothetical protein [Edaphobacter sp.]
MILKIPLVFFFLGQLFHLGATQCNVVRSIPVRLINQAAVNPKVLTEAQREAAWVLKSLCVEVQWAPVPSTKALEMHITVRPLGAGIDKRALGVTILDAERGNRGAVFFSRVLAIKEMFGPLIELARLLGCVLAHEIGHLLLRARAHSPRGIMVANFGETEVLKAAQRRLLFTPFDYEIFSRSQMARASR